jgi:hypothetical protein
MDAPLDRLEQSAPAPVLRLWRGAASPAQVPAYLHHLRTRVEPVLATLDGYLGVAVMTRPVDALVEIVVLTRWQSIAAVSAFAGPDIDAAVVEPEARAVLAEYDTFVRHFTVALEVGND